ncbi:MAG: Fic family protein [Salibacteraceae bacterium]|nr:Fic family protein [Salibacteraceae bacterium]
MITRDLVFKIHAALIKEFGGTHGVRDENGFDSALNRPYATFGETDLYPSPKDKAAAIAQSIITNHPFVDGNKRTGYVLMRLILNQSDIYITATENERYNFIISISEGKLDFDQIKDWIQQNSEKR